MVSSPVDEWHGSTFEDLNKLVNSMARSVGNSYKLNSQHHEDLVQSGWLGVMKAKQRFVNRGIAKFTSYAHPFILGDIITEAKRITKNGDALNLDDLTEFLASHIDVHDQVMLREILNGQDIDLLIQQELQPDKTDKRTSAQQRRKAARDIGRTLYNETYDDPQSV
jgi:DNA-directed RNA polymerase specialized sigma24 family protein